ncbi:MAG: hypothetical protein ABIZ81_14010 [Opitutaceae bacterium]
MFFRRFFVLVAVAVVSAGAQEPLNAPVPLVPPSPATLSSGQVAKQLAAARSAQDLGYNTVAVPLYAALLKEPGVDRSAVTLALTTVLLDDGRAVEAEQVLQADKGPHSAAWHLRAALAAGQLKKVGQMRAEFDATKQPELPKSDHSWHSFLQVMLTDMETPGGDPAKARRFFDEAIAAATTEFVKVRFELAALEEKLRTAPASDADIDVARRIWESNRGRENRYRAARDLAVMYDVSGRKNLAVELLQNLLRTLPRQERERVDDFRLLLGVIGGSAEGAGRNALVELLEQGSVASKQRIALQLLARASESAANRVPFRALLDKLIGRTPPHQILDDLFWVRAQSALASKTADGYVQADRDAASLREQFPKSPLVPYAYWISAQSAWEQRRFRIAADNAAKARDLLPAGEARAELGVFVAEAWFRAGKLARADGAGGAGGAADFRNASDAYAAALADPPASMVPALLFQHVLSEMEAGSLDKAQSLLNAAALNPVFDVRTRWQAEWNLARAFQAAGQTGEAYARVSRLIAADAESKAEALPATLRAQMAWLQAQLSFDDKPSDNTLTLIDKLDRTLEGVEPAMKVDVDSSGMLLKARTNFALKRDRAGLEALEALRKKYEKSPAAISSYMVEADYYALQENVVKAQNLLTKLAEDFPESEYAPHALFSAALQAKRRGGQENYEEGVRRIEKLIELVEKYPPKDPANDLVFEARMTQGDLLRLLNQFSQAQDTYQSLIENNRQHAGVIFAQLALAETYNAQSANDPSYSEKAEVLFFQLMVQLDAPLDVRVEAGYNYGEIFARRGDTAKALEIWWRDVVDTFLLKDRAMADRLGTGRYWLARTLLRYGEILEQQQQLEEAKKAWTLIIQSNLGWTEMARQKLARFNVAEVTP